MKTGIVGCEESKWTENQKPKVKLAVSDILQGVGDSGLVMGDSRVAQIWIYDGKPILVSGRCPKGGVNIWAEEIADELGIKKEIYPAEVNVWNDIIEWDRITEKEPLIQVRRKGFRSRNIQIAEACDVLYCIVPKILPKFKYRLTFADVQRERLQENSYCKHCNTFGHPTNGGCWTMKYAKKLGKETHLVVIE